MPAGIVNYRYDNGFVVGYAFALFKESKSSLSLGLSAKYIKREGLSDRFPIAGSRALDAINRDEGWRDFMKSLGVGVDKGWSGDIGL